MTVLDWIQIVQTTCVCIALLDYYLNKYFVKTKCNELDRDICELFGKYDYAMKRIEAMNTRTEENKTRIDAMNTRHKALMDDLTTFSENIESVIDDVEYKMNVLDNKFEKYMYDQFEKIKSMYYFYKSGDFDGQLSLNDKIDAIFRHYYAIEFDPAIHTIDESTVFESLSDSVKYRIKA